MNNLKTKNRPAGIPGVRTVLVNKEDMIHEELSRRLGGTVAVHRQVVRQTRVIDAAGPLRAGKGQPLPEEDLAAAVAEKNCDQVIRFIATAPETSRRAFLKRFTERLLGESPEAMDILASEVLGTGNGTDAFRKTVAEMKEDLKQAEGSVRRAENRACKAENDVASLERKLDESETLRQGYVRRVAELERNLSAAKAENSRLSEELVLSRRDRDQDPPKDDSAMIENCLALEQENAELKARIAAKDALLSGITSSAGVCSCGLDVPERELAPGEIKALLVTLAADRLSSMSDSTRRTTGHRRLLDLLSAIVANNPVPESYLEFCRSVHDLKGSSKQTAYVREMLRIGFEEQNNPGTHRKFYFRGDERYCTMQGVSPSDVKAMDSSTHQIELMLLIPGAESVSPQGENMI